MESLQSVTIAGTVNELNNTSLNAFVKGIDGLTLSQAQAALSTRALTDAQKEQILTSAGLLQSAQAITLEEIKQMASSMSLSTKKKEEILTTLQGAYAENEWNKEKLEAIVASGGEAGAIAESILAKKAENAENVKNIAGRKALTASLKEELATRLALMASNPAVWIAGVAAVSVGLIALQEKFSKSLEECTEELEDYNSEFDTAQSSVESLETELKTCTSRLDELQKLADNGTISIIEQEEYERLQKTNDELERNIRIEREKAQLSAIDAAKSADETLSKTVESKYVTSLQDFSGVGVESEYASWITPQEELEASIAEYDKLQKQIDALNQSYDNGSISADDYNKQLIDLTDQQTKARTRASEMSDILVESEQAYTNLTNTGAELTTTQTANYINVKQANEAYNNFLGTINGVNEAFENLDTTEKAQTLKDRYAKKTLSLPNGQGTYTVDNKEISDWIDTLSDDDLKILGTINFSGEQTKDSMQEALDYAKTHTDITGNESIDLSDVFSFKNAENEATILSELNDKLSEVKSAYETCLSAKEEYDEQGYLSVDTLQKVISLGDDYLQYLFDEQGNVKLDAEAFKQLTLARINDMEAQALQNLAENIKQITDEATATEYLAQKQNELASSYTDVAINALLAMQQIKGFSNSEALQGAYNSFKTQYEQIKSLFAHTRSGLGKEFNGISDSAKKATEDAEKATKDYIDSYMDYMEKSLETGRIDYQTYSRDVAKFLKDMYDQGKIAAKDYHDYTKQMLEVQKDAMDSVISAVTNRLDKEIDFYEDQIDAVEERYQTEIDYLDTVIEYYEDQKKALQDTNDELDRQKALEEALYNFERAQDQKTQKVNYMPSYYSNVVCKK